MKVFNKVFLYLVISLAVCLFFSLKTQAVHSGGGDVVPAAPDGKIYAYYYEVEFPDLYNEYCEDGLYMLWSDFPAALVLDCEMDGNIYHNTVFFYDQVKDSFSTSVSSLDGIYYCFSVPSKRIYTHREGEANKLYAYPYTSYTQTIKVGNSTLPIVATLDDFQVSLLPDPNDYTYSADLGYLADMHKLTSFSYVDGYNAFRIDNYNFNWATVTTSGIDLHNHDYDSLQIQPMVYATLHTYDDSGSLVGSKPDSYTWDSFDSSADGWSISFNDLKKALPSIYDMQVLLGRDRNWSIDSSYYFRLLAQKDGVNYRGGWVKVTLKFLSDDQLQVDTISGDLIGDDFVPDPAGPSGSSTSPIGTIISPDKPPQIEIDGNSGIIDSLQGMLQEVGQIPQIYAVIFSFLPKWCLDLLGIAFGFMVVLLVIKVVRG